MSRAANVAAPGYAAFALSLWMNGMVGAGWFGPSAATFATVLGTILGGGVMALTGILQYLRGRDLDTFVFLIFAGYWWIALLATRAIGQWQPLPHGLLGWNAMIWALLAFCLWLAARKEGSARMLFLLGLCLSLFAQALAHWLHLDALTVLGGYLGLVTAVIGFYIGAAEIINQTHERTVLPLGETSTRGKSTSAH